MICHVPILSNAWERNSARLLLSNVYLLRSNFFTQKEPFPHTEIDLGTKLLL